MRRKRQYHKKNMEFWGNKSKVNNRKFYVYLRELRTKGEGLICKAIDIEDARTIWQAINSVKSYAEKHGSMTTPACPF